MPPKAPAQKMLREKGMDGWVGGGVDDEGVSVAFREGKLSRQVHVNSKSPFGHPGHMLFFFSITPLQDWDSLMTPDTGLHSFISIS